MEKRLSKANNAQLAVLPVQILETFFLDNPLLWELVLLGTFGTQGDRECEDPHNIFVSLLLNTSGLETALFSEARSKQEELLTKIMKFGVSSGAYLVNYHKLPITVEPAYREGLFRVQADIFLGDSNLLGTDNGIILVKRAKGSTLLQSYQADRYQNVDPNFFLYQVNKYLLSGYLLLEGEEVVPLPEYSKFVDLGLLQVL